MVRRRAVNTSDKKEKHDDSQVKVPSDTNNLSSCNIGVVFKTCMTCFLVLYVLAPMVLYYVPSIIEQLTFMNLQCSEDEKASLVRPSSEYNLHGTATFYLDCEDVKLGLWHILPQELISTYDDDHIATEEAIGAVLQDAENVIIYHHGNSQSRATGDGMHRAKLYSVLQAEGYHVIAFDYRGFGDSLDWPSESGLLKDSQCILKWVRKLVPDTTKVSFWGHSLGSAIATLSAAETAQCNNSKELCARIDRLVLEGPFMNLRIAAEANLPARLFKMFYPSSLLRTILDACLSVYQLNLATDQSISKVQCPILILHAEDDDSIPFEHGQGLFKICDEAKLGHRVKLVKFRARHAYSHLYIYRAPELPKMLREFLLNEDKPVVESIVI